MKSRISLLIGYGRPSGGSLGAWKTGQNITNFRGKRTGEHSLRLKATQIFQLIIVLKSVKLFLGWI